MPTSKKPKKTTLLNTEEMRPMTAKNWDFEPLIPLPANFLKDALEEILSSLSVRQRRVLELRFGLDDGRSKSLKETARALRISQKRAQMIEETALRKLRHPGQHKRLADYTE